MLSLYILSAAVIPTTPVIAKLFCIKPPRNKHRFFPVSYTHLDVYKRQVEDIREVLSSIDQPSLIIGIQSDGLFTYSEQEFLHEHIPKSRLEKIESPEGHDAFLLEFKLINKLIVDFLKTNCKVITDAKPRTWRGDVGNDETKTSVFGEAEEVTNW